MELPSSLIISNLNKGPAASLEKEIYEILDKYGEYEFSKKVIGVRPATNPQNQEECVGYALIDFEDHLYAKEALCHMVEVKSIRTNRRLNIRLNTSGSKPSQIEDYTILLNGIPNRFSETDLLKILQSYDSAIRCIKIHPYHNGSNTSYGFLKVDPKVDTQQTIIILKEIARFIFPQFRFYQINQHNLISQEKHNSSLFVTNLNLGVTSEIIEYHFSQFGPINSIIHYPEKNFCFIHYSRRIHAIAALTLMDGAKIFHQKVACTWAFHKGFQLSELEDPTFKYQVSKEESSYDRPDLLPSKSNREERFFSKISTHNHGIYSQEKQDMVTKSISENAFWFALYAENPLICANDLIKS